MKYISNKVLIATMCLMCSVTVRASSSITPEMTGIPTIGGTSNGANCYFPFTFQGVNYTSCTTAGRYDDLLWCATTGDYATDNEWGECPYVVDGCDSNNWVEHEGNCYQFNSGSTLDYWGARDFCRKQKSSLLSINSQQEQSFIAGKVQQHEVVMWLGLSDGTVEGEWSWEDGSPLTYFNWKAGQPNSYGGNEDCGAMVTKAGYWGDTWCGRKCMFTCKKKKPVPETTASPSTSAAPGSSINVACYTGKGEYYKGNVSKAMGGLTCSDWTANSSPSHPSFSLTGNKCRNPDGSEKPWCYVTKAGLSDVWEYCDIPKCTNDLERHCDDGWKKIGKACFKVGCTVETWQESKKKCAAAGGRLANIDSKSQQQSINIWFGSFNEKISYKNLWIGLNDIYHEMWFAWDSNSDAPKYTNWDNNQPIDPKGENDCVQMKVANSDSQSDDMGKWDEQLCALKKRYLCEKQPLRLFESADANTDLVGTCIKNKASKSNTTSLDDGCGRGFKGYQHFCYKPEHVKLSWGNALSYCRQNYGPKANLWAPHNVYEEAFIVTLIAKNSNPGDTWHTGVVGIPLVKNDSSSYTFVQNVDELMNPNGTVNYNASKSPQKIIYSKWDVNQPKLPENVTRIVPVYLSSGYTPGFWSLEATDKTKRKFACTTPRMGWTTPPPPTTTTPMGGCPDGYITKPTKCIKAFTQSDMKRSWQEAMAYCEQLTGPGNPGHGGLVSIHSSDENEIISSDTHGYFNLFKNYWIGLNRRDTEDKWKWSDRSKVDFITWDEGQPNNAAGLQECGLVQGRTNKWNDGNCNAKIQFICQVDRGVDVVEVNETKKEDPTKCSGSTNETVWYAYKGYCYYFSDDQRKSYYESRKACHDIGGELTSINDHDELNFVHDHAHKFRNSAWWIGLDMNNKDQEYKWIDGSLSSFRAWELDEPNYLNKQETCTQLKVDEAFWNDVNCGTVTSFICKKRNNSVIAPTYPPQYNVVGECPDGWLSYRAICLQINDEKLSWTDARDRCMATGGNLVSIPNVQQQAFVAISLKSHNQSSYWNGLNMVGVRWSMQWRDGTPYKYENWARSASPILRYVMRSDEECTFIKTDTYEYGKWDTDSCSKNKSFICEMDKKLKLSDYCEDREDKGEKGYCAELQRNTTCKGLTTTQKLKCKKTCNFCLDFFKKAQPVENKCAKGWHEFDGDCYTLTKEKYTWQEAQEQCKSNDASLINIYDEFVQLVAIAMTSDPSENPETAAGKGVRSWMGLKLEDAKDGGSIFAWTQKWPLEIANWGPNQPTFKNGTKSKCGAFDGTETSERTPHEDAKYGYWYNLKCDTKFQALCQKTSKVAPPKSEYESYSCPNASWTSHRGACYKLLETDRSAWYQSSYECKMFKNAFPVSVMDDEENNFVLKLAMRKANSHSFVFSQPNVWLGLHKSVDDGFIEWEDNSPVTYTNWDDGEPNYRSSYRSKKCYVIQMNNGRWASESCSRRNTMICKTPKIPIYSASSQQNAKTKHTAMTVVIVLLVLTICTMGLYMVYRARGGNLNLPSIQFNDYLPAQFKRSSTGDRSGLITSMEEDC